VYVVQRDGSIRMPGRDLLLSKVLRGEPVAVEVCEDDTVRNNSICEIVESVYINLINNIK
jgi:hypothetical protein